MSKFGRQYLIFTFSIMAICWGTCVLFSLSGIYLTEIPLLYIPYILGGLSPTIASYIAEKKNCRVRSFKEWLIILFLN